MELEARTTFVLVVKNFLGNNKTTNCVDLVTLCRPLSPQNFGHYAETLDSTWVQKCIFFLFTHICLIHANLGSMSGEKVERFHQDMTRYQGRWDAVIITDCWTLMRDITGKHSTCSRKHKIKLWISNDDSLTCNWQTLQCTLLNFKI